MYNAFKIEKIFDQDEIENLKSLFESCSENLAHQDYNLYDVDKRIIPNSATHPVLQKLNQYVDLTPMSHYFVKYDVEGFTSLHTDDDGVVKLTVVTLLDDVDLIGGETLVLDRYVKNARPAYKYAKRGKMGEAPIGSSRIPVIARMKPGDSISYDNAVKHGVCQVEQGHRIVLVSWYKEHD